MSALALATNNNMRKILTRNTIIIFFIIVIGVGYWAYKRYANTSGETRYVLTAVKKGTIVSSITGTGQVAASSQVDIKSKVSGDATYIGVVNGQTVKAGALIAQIDARDAEIALESAKISLDKLIKPADASSILLAENSLADARQSNVKATDDLVKSYDDGFNTVSNAFLDLPDVMTGLNDLLNSYRSGDGYLNDANVRFYGDTAMIYRNDATTAYFTVKNKYDANLTNYKNLTRASPTSNIESLITETYSTIKSATDAIKNSKNAVDFIRSQQGSQSRNDSTTVLTNLNSWTSKVNTHLLNLLSIKNSIENSKNTITSSARDIAQKIESLKKLIDGADALDIRSQELAVRQKEYAYQDYFIRAQFEGVIAKLNVKKTDSVSSGSIIGILVTKQKVADISLNEIDAARVKVGQKVTITFDAIPELTITGKVIETDLVGTVNQGVVTYNIKIGFDTQDDQVKPGMSVSAAIITDVVPDALAAPNSAVKSQGESHYVEMFDHAFPENQSSQGVVSPIAPRRQPVEIGMSDDSSTEIISGLNEGDVIVSRTISSNSTQPQTTQQSGGGFRIPGLPGGGSGRGGVGR